jgi:hypothetical protein
MYRLDGERPEDSPLRDSLPLARRPWAVAAFAIARPEIPPPIGRDRVASVLARFVRWTAGYEFIMRWHSWVDRYDIVAVVSLIAVVVVGVMATGQWLFFVVLGAAVGNIAGYVCRRRAGLPCRSAYGRVFGRRR